VVTVQGYDASAAGTDFSVDWGNGTTWEALTRGSTYTTGGGVSSTFYKITPTTSYDRFRVTTTRAYDEGVSASYAAYSSDGTPVHIYSASNFLAGDGNITVTLTGGASGDLIYVGGADYQFSGTAFSLTNQSQTLIESQTTTACNNQHYGHASKDWSSGAICQTTGYYPYVGAMAFNDPGGGGGGATNPGWYSNKGGWF
jgi:hypothetical protein